MGMRVLLCPVVVFSDWWVWGCSPVPWFSSVGESPLRLLKRASGTVCCGIV